MPRPADAAGVNLDEVRRLLERHRVLESLAGRQQTDKRDLLSQMQRRENLAELKRYLHGGHPADLAHVLRTLAPGDRNLVFSQLDQRQAGLTLVELQDETRDALIRDLDRGALAAVVATLDADDLAYLSGALPDEIVDRAADALGAADQSWVWDVDTYPEATVGRLMRRDVATVRLDQSVSGALASCRGGEDLPPQTDRLFVIDARHILRGSVLLQDLVRVDPAAMIDQIARHPSDVFRPLDPASDVTKRFERYDLVSAPVVDDVGKLIGRVTIDAVVDYVRDRAQDDALAQAGLRGAEDLFAPLSASIRNRWPWLAVNLVTAFAASRVIGAFEGTISRLVALAALMPIVASIGGNTGNQTVALVVRALALDQLHGAGRQLVRRELVVGAVNGAAWGVIVGMIALVIYGQPALSAVMTAAVFLNLVVAAMAGVLVPLALRWSGRDPVHGSSVVLTFVTDGMGFLFLLGLAQWWLL